MRKIYFAILLLFVLSCGKEEKGLNLTIEPMVAAMLNEVSSEVELVVNSDADWTLEHYEPSSIPTWFEMTPLSGKAGISKVMLKVLEVNVESVERVSFITFKTKVMTKTVTVKQASPVEEETPEELPEPEEKQSFS